MLERHYLSRACRRRRSGCVPTKRHFAGDRRIDVGSGLDRPRGQYSAPSEVRPRLDHACTGRAEHGRRRLLLEEQEASNSCRDALLLDPWRRRLLESIIRRCNRRACGHRAGTEDASPTRTYVSVWLSFYHLEQQLITLGTTYGKRRSATGFRPHCKRPRN
jgi:hypothetical protein